MIERFDVLAPSRNVTYNRFRIEHIKRYMIAAGFLGNLPKDSLIVDAASGCGYGYDYLSPLGRYVGLDCSMAAISASKARYPLGDFRLADFDRYVAWDRLMPDAVVSLETAEHLKNPPRFLKAIRNVLPHGGRLVFSAPTSKTMDFDPYHLRDWDSDRWESELKAAGFAIVRAIAMPFETSFWQFLAVTPTTWLQKASVIGFLLRHPTYLADRLWNWGLRNRFYWESTIYFCVASVAPLSASKNGPISSAAISPE